MKHETFSAWLAQHRGKDTRTGDLAGDVANDSKWKEPGSFDDLMAHLTMRGACREARDAAKRAWRMFEKQRPSNIDAQWLALASAMIDSFEGAVTTVGGPANEQAEANLRFATVAKYHAFCKAFDATAARVKAGRKP